MGSSCSCETAEDAKVAKSADSSIPAAPGSTRIRRSLSGLGYAERKLQNKASGRLDSAAPACLQEGAADIPASPASPSEEHSAGGACENALQPQRSDAHPAAAADPVPPEVTQDQALGRTKSKRRTTVIDKGVRSAEEGIQEPKKEESSQNPPTRKRANSLSCLHMPVGGLLAAVSAPGGAFEGGPHEAGVLGITQSRGLVEVIEEEFLEKSIEHSGHRNPDFIKCKLSDAGVEAVCSKGRKPESPNQDNYFVTCAGNFVLCCVADGHGKSGHWVSHWTAKFVLRLLLEEVSQSKSLPSDKAVIKIFDTVHKELMSTAQSHMFDLWLSGSTLSVAVVSRSSSDLLLAWVGDSRCVLGRSAAQQGPPKCVGSSDDHKPEHREEQQRILASGGEVVLLPGDVPHRIFVKDCEYPGLAMSRAVGDLAAHLVGVTHHPGIKRLKYQKGDLLLCCSDGVWEFISNEQALSTVMKAGPKKARDSLKKLVADSRDLWLQDDPETCDDITAVSLFL